MLTKQLRGQVVLKILSVSKRKLLELVLSFASLTGSLSGWLEVTFRLVEPESHSANPRVSSGP